MRVVVVCQARMGSHRLPGKSLMDLCGKPLIQHVLERAALVAGARHVVLATSHADRDAELARVGRALGYGVVRGSEGDVLDRVLQAARAHEADAVMRVTGDCPLLAPDVATDVLDLFRERRGGADFVCYASNDTTKSGFPDGMDVEVFSRDALELAALKARENGEREHVTPWIRRYCPTAMLRKAQPRIAPSLKLSVDAEEDLAVVRRVMARVPPGRVWYEDTADAVASVLRAEGL